MKQNNVIEEKIKEISNMTHDCIDMLPSISFVDEKDFEDKRFNRYVNKIKEFIMEKYVNKLDEKQENGHIKDLNEFILLYFIIDFLEIDVRDRQKIINALKAIQLHNYSEKSKVPSDSEEIKKYLFKNINNTKPIDEIIEEETKKVCKEYIKQRCIELRNEKIELCNYYTKTFPTDVSQAIDLINKIVNYVKIDIDNIYLNKIKSKEKLISVKEYDTLEKEKNELKKQVKELEEKMKIKEKQIKRLNEKYNNKNEDEYTKSLKENNRTLEKQNIKLNEKYNSLLEKYNKLKENNKKEEYIEEKQYNIPEEISLKKYLFVASEDSTFKQTILNEFKNSSFCFSNININTNTDLVIVITSHIDHSTYYAIKDQCNQKNIPFLHCKYSNTERIKQLIWDSQNKLN